MLNTGRWAITAGQTFSPPSFRPFRRTSVAAGCPIAARMKRKACSPVFGVQAFLLATQ